MKKNTQDRIDFLVDNLDKYFFRISTAINTLGGSEYCSAPDRKWLAEIAPLFYAPEWQEAHDCFYENLEEVEKKIPGMLQAIESASIALAIAERDFDVLLGFVLGLRVAGMSGDQTKRMARTWRIGLPQDDPQ